MTERTAPFLSPAMRRVVIVVAVVVVLGLGIALWLAFGPNSGRGAGDASPDPASSASSEPTTGPLPGATPTTGSEVLPPSEGGGSDRLPPRTVQAPLVAAPLPPSASALGSLVDGFPSAIVGPMSGSDVVESSIATEGDRMQVTLTARTDATADAVTKHFEASWSALGLHSTPDAGTAALTFAGPYESMTLAFSTGTGTGTVYMIYSVFRTK